MMSNRKCMRNLQNKLKHKLDHLGPDHTTSDSRIALGLHVWKHIQGIVIQLKQLVVRRDISINFIALNNMRWLRRNQDPLILNLLKRLATAITELLNFNRIHDFDDVLQLWAIHCQTDFFPETNYVTFDAHDCHDLVEVTTKAINLLQTYGST
jgi:hypothetical protein